MLTERKTCINNITGITIALLCVLLLTLLPTSALADDTNEKEQDLSTINWDTEEEPTPGKSDKVEDNLATTSWEDEDSDPFKDAENEIEDRKRENEYIEIERQERAKQIAGFGIFCFYFFGMFLTAYFTRNRRLAVNYSPELLILLHALWPIQWLLLPFFGQKVR